MSVHKPIASYIDHTLLKPTATEADINKLCHEATTHGFHSVCINGCHVALAKKELGRTTVGICTVVGFPLGAMSTGAKVAEAKDYVDKGADEIDMVINIGWIKSNSENRVRDEIAAIKKAIDDRILKVILETCYLTQAEKRTVCELALEAKADFVKTSTGFGTAGATLADIKLMKAVVGDQMGIKASGGIRDRETALRFIDQGASRIGTSSGVAIVLSSTKQGS
ncbi:deoxyribose-phosphate aldolase [Flagellimonas lutaonensis]|uniref:Deoxyribose-phosphate aldolase n=1 Tax=Flagellimonas lutaonensis TaxID=516051 RepID=A0A0D5YQS5_9FLAO|nr:deoxyribose-phosphate aldolase [Allomuricauda lutaonensis]AKA34243.1 deoxyribose-phosphate aldolase [Allomuricauda lutaonensis]